MSVSDSKVPAPDDTIRARGYHRFSIGNFHAALLLDGWLDHPLAGFIGGPEADIASLHLTAYPSDARWPMDMNVTYVDTGTNKVLVDAGLGAFAWYGPDSGRLAKAMEGAGVDPAAIDHVILTHADPDHCFGLVDALGEKAFPNARVAISRTEYEFWTQGATIDGKTARKDWAEAARGVLDQYKDGLLFFDGNAEILPGISVIQCEGHSPGHHAVLFTSNSEKFLVAGDVAHHHLVETHHPDWLFLWDFDPPAGVRSKRMIFDRLSEEGCRFVGYHFPFPAIGRLKRDGAAYRYEQALDRTA